MHAGAGVGPPEAHLHPLRVPLPRSVSPYRCPRGHLGALLQQPLHHAQVPLKGSFMERRRVVLVGRRGAGGATGVTGGVRVKGKGRGEGGETGGGEGREGPGKRAGRPRGRTRLPL